MVTYRTGAKSSILQAIGVDQATAEGAIKKLKLSSDNEWTQIWTSDRVVAKESGVNIPEKCTVEYKFSESIAIKIEVVDERTEENVGVYMTYLSEIVSEGQVIVYTHVKRCKYSSLFTNSRALAASRVFGRKNKRSLGAIQWSIDNWISRESPRF